jgi:5-formyltetrahydrofolate cyclo-ligase
MLLEKKENKIFKMNKTELRQKYKALRNLLSENEVEEMSLAIANKILILPLWEKTYFHIFLPITEQKEVNTEFILHILSGKDKEIIVSKADFATRNMTHFLLTDNTKIKKNEYNIPEPVDGIEVPSNKIDVVFVPLLAFDKKGHRVGYGKGFYDKFLSECKPDAIKIGLSFFEPEELITDVFEGDIKLDYCVTPNSIHSF